MRKIFIISLLLLSQCSNPEHVRYFKLAELKRVEQLTLIQPPPALISFTHVYVVGVNDSIYESSFTRLKDIYSSQYKNAYPSLADFLFDVLNQEVKIDAKVSQSNLYFTQIFRADSKIAVLYREKGINGLKDKYCMDSNGFCTLKKDRLTVNEINSISYYFFLNQYMRTDDDYRATINFRKLASMLN